ncbi:hypothetical protein [Gimesia sp.]|uniref:hypothetical protein n=1 Tax=Gimesia sp. TaxID=2024833 RepID=UPI003A953CEE
MKTKKRFQKLVQDLRNSLPKEKVYLAEDLHRTAGETRREFTSLQKSLADETQRREHLQVRLAATSKEIQKAKDDSKTSQSKLRELEKEFALLTKMHSKQLLPYHDSVIDKILEFLRVIDPGASSLETVRQHIEDGFINLDADVTTTLDSLTDEDVVRILQYVGNASREVFFDNLTEDANGLFDIAPELAELTLKRMHYGVCDYLATAYLKGDICLPLHPSVIEFTGRLSNLPLSDIRITMYE